MASNTKFTIEQVKRICLNSNLELLSTEYENELTKLSLKCSNGHFITKTLKSIRKGTGCDECAKIVRGNKRRLSYSKVKSYIELFGYKLLSEEYVTAKTLLQLMCPEGHIYEGNFSNFKYNKRRCPKCDDLSKSQEGHPNWKGGITPESSQLRNSPEGKEWKIFVFKRDNYTCQCCGTRGGDLEAHHIENFSTNEDLRFETNNGVTLCKNCHSLTIEGSFHRIYGVNNNTKVQLEEYIKRYRLGEFNSLREEKFSQVS